MWIGTFTFSRCRSTCPLQTAQFAQLQKEVPLRTHDSWKDIRLITFTVDPGYDTPEILRNYGLRNGADASHWKFLTGSRAAIWDLCKRGFTLAITSSPDKADQLIVHSQRFILVDRAGRIRGYYDGLNAGDRQMLVRDLKDVLQEESP